MGVEYNMQIIVTNLKSMTTFQFKRVEKGFINNLITNLSEQNNSINYSITVAEEENEFNSTDSRVNITQVTGRG